MEALTVHDFRDALRRDINRYIRLRWGFVRIVYTGEAFDFSSTRLRIALFPVRRLAVLQWGRNVDQEKVTSRSSSV